MMRLFFVVWLLSSSVSAMPSTVLEFSPLRAAIGEADVRFEQSVSERSSFSLRVSSANRQQEGLEEAEETIQTAQGTWLYYPKIEQVEGLFIGPKMAYTVYTQNFSTPLPISTNGSYNAYPEQSWRSRIERVSAGAHLGWRFSLAKYATLSCSAEVLSTLSQRVQILQEDLSYPDANKEEQTPDRFERRLMLHVGLAIP